MTNCAWCEQELDVADRQSIRLANAQPPWTARSGFGTARAIASAGAAFAATLRARSTAEPPIELWFHRPCWRDFLELLRGRR